MNKVFYKKGSKQDYSFYNFVYWFLTIIIICLFLLMLISMNKVIIICLICCILVLVFLYLKIEFMLIKNLDFNAYIINAETNEFYKVGVYPKFVGALPNDEDFMQDKHFMYDSYNFKFDIKMLFKYQSGYKNSRGTLSIVNALSKLHNENYLLKQLKKKNTMDIIYKITNIYSVEFNEENNSYSVICDAVKHDNKTILEKTTMYINKDFDENNEIKKYIEKSLEK